MKIRSLAIGGVLAGAALVTACSFVSSLDYLQAGGPADGGDEVTDDHAVVPEGGVAPEVFAPAQDVPTVIALDDTAVYWYAGGSTKAILKAPKAGGPAATVAPVTDPPTYLYAEKGDGVGEIFWASGSTIFRASKDATTPGVAKPVYVVPGNVPVNGLAVDEASIYVGASDLNNGVYEFSRSNRVDGGNHVVLDDLDEVDAISIDGPTLVWSDSLVVNFAPKTITPDGGIDAAGHYGDDTNDIIAPLGQTYWAVEPNAIYWSDGVGISKNPRTPDVVGTLLFDDEQTTTGDVRGLAVDATYVWFIHAKSAEIRRVTKTGGDLPQTMVQKQVNVRGIAVDDAFVYFTLQGSDPKTGAVLRIPSH